MKTVILRSPVCGTVKQIYIHTEGGVVKLGESIMDIVPLNDTLLVEARVRPADVDIMTGKKSILDYLLKPILKARQNALRER